MLKFENEIKTFALLNIDNFEHAFIDTEFAQEYSIAKISKN